MQCHWIFVTSEVKRLAVGNKHITVNERTAQEVISKPVILRAVEVNGEKRHTMFKSQLFAEVLVTLKDCMHLINSLRKARYPIIWFILSIHVIDHVVDGLNHVFKIALSLG